MGFIKFTKIFSGINFTNVNKKDVRLIKEEWKNRGEIFENIFDILNMELEKTKEIEKIEEETGINFEEFFRIYGVEWDKRDFIVIYFDNKPLLKVPEKYVTLVWDNRTVLYRKWGEKLRAIKDERMIDDKTFNILLNIVWNIDMENEWLKNLNNKIKKYNVEIIKEGGEVNG